MLQHPALMYGFSRLSYTPESDALGEVTDCHDGEDEPRASNGKDIRA